MAYCSLQLAEPEVTLKDESDLSPPPETSVRSRVVLHEKVNVIRMVLLDSRLWRAWSKTPGSDEEIVRMPRGRISDPL